MTERPKHRVSVKIALFNVTRDKVLMTKLPGGGYGLPGGHVEGVEQPDDALWRELKEELGLEVGDYNAVKQNSFWREDNGDRIILGYTGQLIHVDTMRLDPVEVAGVIWVSRDDIEQGIISSDAYNSYLLKVL